MQKWGTRLNLKREYDTIGLSTIVYELEESRVRSRVTKIIAALAMCLMLASSAFAEQMVTTTVVMRVSHMTQNAVVDAGEDPVSYTHLTLPTILRV